MNVMDCFSGIGGGILGSILLGHRIVCAIEKDAYCRSILVHHQNAGHLVPFPIWDDICTFDGREWTGLVDMVQGGFPCQDISCSGRGAGITGSRSGLWKEMFRVVWEVKPEWVFIENVQALVKRGLDTVLSDLSDGGYKSEWIILGADDCGAPHQRKRCWVLAHSESNGRKTFGLSIGTAAEHTMFGGGGKVSDPDCQRQQQPQGLVKDKRRRAGNVCKKISDSENERIIRRNRKQEYYYESDGAEADNKGGSEGNDCQWWAVEPSMGRLAYGLPNRVDALRGLGNAQVPACAAAAFLVLYNRLKRREQK